MKPKVSIIIPVYNGSNYLKEAIDSAIAQTYDNVEILVINDGSTDDGATEKIAKSYGDKIRYFNKKNGGVATALNLGIEKMTGEYFSWLSHDDMYYPEKIEKQVAAIIGLSDKVIVYSNVEYINDRSEPISHTSYELKHTKNELMNSMFCLLYGYANGCSLLIPKKCLIDMGGFDESTKTSNDYELWSRLFRYCSVVFVPDVLTKYRLHESQDTKTSSVYSSESSNVWLKIVNELTDSDVRDFSSNLFEFYYNFSLRLKAENCTKAYGIIRKKAKYHYENSKRSVSIIMPCYNTIKYLKIAIDSILSQTFCDFELIIVDDGSDDGSYELAKKMSKIDYRIVILKNKQEKGISGAMNTGLDYASGRYITRMDSDDISISQRIEKQFNFLENNSEYGLCSVNINGINDKGDITYPVLFKEKEAPLEWLFLWENPIANAPTMYRFDILNGKKMRFRNLKTAEDYDLLCRVVLGTRVHQINEVLYQYRIHGESIFQKNIEITLKNSINISREFAKKITGINTPKFHDFFTVFNQYNQDMCDYIDYSLWMDKLLESSKKQWNWSKTEYDFAKKDANIRISKLLNCNMNNSDCDSMNEESASKPRYLFVNNLISLFYRAIKKIKNDGLLETTKAFIRKVKNRIK